MFISKQKLKCLKSIYRLACPIFVFNDAFNHDILESTFKSSWDESIHFVRGFDKCEFSAKTLLIGWTCFISEIGQLSCFSHNTHQMCGSMTICSEIE